MNPELKILDPSPLRVAATFPAGQSEWIVRELAAGTLTLLVQIGGRQTTVRQDGPALFTPGHTTVQFRGVPVDT